MWYFYQIFCIIILVIVANVGDWLLVNIENSVYKAFIDNITHALIGLFAWLLVSVNIKYSNILYLLLDSLLCMVIASLIDLDHFCAAKSFYLKDATALQQRPFLHNTTIPVMVTISLLVLAHAMNNIYLERFAFIVFVAFGTHHTRDAHRRGYLFAPLGSTAPLPYNFYIFITILIPYVVVLWLKSFKISKRIAIVSVENNMDQMQLLP